MFCNFFMYIDTYICTYKTNMYIHVYNDNDDDVVSSNLVRKSAR